MWQRIKDRILKIFRNREVPEVTQVLVTTWYCGIGVMLTLMTGSVGLFLIFVVPAIIWWSVATCHSASISYASAD